MQTTVKQKDWYRLLALLVLCLLLFLADRQWKNRDLLFPEERQRVEQEVPNRYDVMGQLRFF